MRTRYTLFLKSHDGVSGGIAENLLGGKARNRQTGNEAVSSWCDGGLTECIRYIWRVDRNHVRQRRNSYVDAAGLTARHMLLASFPLCAGDEKCVNFLTVCLPGGAK